MKGNFKTGLILNVLPVPCVIDHTFRYFEQSESKTEIVLPPLYAYSLPDTNRNIVSTNKSVRVVDINQNEIKLKFRT